MVGLGGEGDCFAVVEVEERIAEGGVGADVCEAEGGVGGFGQVVDEADGGVAGEEFCAW